MLLQRLTRVALAVTTLTAVALSTGVPVASAATPSAAPHVKVLQRAGVQADGAGAAVTVRVRCDSGTAYLTVTVTQSRGSDTPVSGTGSPTVPCTGAAQKVRVGVPATSFADLLPASSAPFELGDVLVSAEVTVCRADSTCSYDQSYGTVQLTGATIEDTSYESPELTVSLPDEASLEADGAGVVIEVPYTCAPGLFALAGGTLAQLTSPGLVSLSDDQIGLRCTSSNRSGVLVFHAQAAAFVEGTAFVVLDADYCGGFDICISPLVFATVQVE